MLSDIVAQAIVPESDMTIVAGVDGEMDGLKILLRRRQIDVVIFTAGDANFSETAISYLLHANPRLGLLEIDGVAGEGTLHHLVPARDRIGRLAQSSVAGAIRAGAALRRR